MHGVGTGVLNVYVKTRLNKTAKVFSSYGDHANEWIRSMVNVTGDVQAVFEAVRGVRYTCDIALDNVLLLEGPCPAIRKY